MRKLTPNPLIALLAAIGLLFAVTAHAQSPEPPPTAPVAEVNVSSQEVKQFADAYVAVQSINQEYVARLQSIEDPDQSTKLQQEAQTKMQQAVTDSGLSISDYQAIAEQANQNEELRGDIEQAVSALIEQPPQPAQ